MTSHEEIKQQAGKFKNRLAKLQESDLQPIPELPPLPHSDNKKLTDAELREQNKLLRQWSGQVYMVIKELNSQYNEIKWFLAAIDSFLAIYSEKEEEHGTNNELSL